jgi:signal transduction histidine kinase
MTPERAQAKRDVRGRDVRTVLLILAPGLLGVVASLIWRALGGGPRYYVLGSLTWWPAILGCLVVAVLASAFGVVRLERRRAEQERTLAVEEAAARQRRLFARLDHELKNPIQGIMVALADEPSDRQRVSIQAQAQRLSSLLGDLRKIGEVEHTDLELVMIDPTALVEDAVATIRELPGASERRITATLPRAPRPLPPVLGDEDLMFLALTNVLANAVKYSGAGDAIEVRGRLEEEHVVLEVADTGRGIRAEDLALVWEELGRAEEARALD